MMIITVQVAAPLGTAIGVKEDLAMYLERFGDAKVISINESTPEQLTMAIWSGTDESARAKQ